MPRRRRWLWPVGEPVFPLTVAGHGRIEHRHLTDSRRLSDLAGTPPVEWGVLFVIDSRGHRWTLYSPDPDYTAMFAPTAHELSLDFTIFTTKFPAWNSNWAIG